jgi:hypothetical protein
VSHVVTIRTEVRDAAAVEPACQRLGRPLPSHGSLPTTAIHFGTHRSTVSAHTKRLAPYSSLSKRCQLSCSRHGSTRCVLAAQRRRSVSKNEESHSVRHSNAARARVSPTGK